MSTGNIDLSTLKIIALAIENIDKIPLSKINLYIDMNIYRLKESRRNMINILTSCGYELEPDTYKIIKSTKIRDLLS